MIKVITKLEYRSILFLFFFMPALLYSQTATLEATLSLKDFNGVKIPYQNGFPVPSFEKNYREVIDLKGDWKKQRFTADDNITLAKRDVDGYQNLINEAANRHLASFDDGKKMVYLK